MDSHMWKGSKFQIADLEFWQSLRRRKGVIIKVMRVTNSLLLNQVEAIKRFCYIWVIKLSLMARITASDLLSLGGLIHECFDAFNSSVELIISHLYVYYSLNKGFYYWKSLIFTLERVFTLKCHLNTTFTKLCTKFMTTAPLRFLRVLSSIHSTC